MTVTDKSYPIVTHKKGELVRNEKSRRRRIGLIITNDKVFPAWAGMNRGGGHGARDRDIRAQFDHLLYADVPSAEAIGMLRARYGLSERSLRRILKK